MESVPTLLTFPVEIIYRILDELDADDILFSFRNVCTRFYSITNNYNRLVIKFIEKSSKFYIQRMYRIIQPENVISLTVGNLSSLFDDMNGFFVFTNIHRYTQLRTLNLSFMKEYHLTSIIHHLTILSTLRSLSLTIYNRNSINNDTLVHLSKIIEMSNLHKLVLWIQNKILDEISWSNQSKLQELYISGCTYKQLFYILHHLSNLQTLAFDYCDMHNIDKSIHLTQFPQLTSLTIKRMNMLIDQLEFLLSFLPSLLYLDLGRGLDLSLTFLQRFCQWEQFISQKLPQLEHFYFEFFSSKHNYEDIQNIESIITAFRTPFWLEQKRWFVTCEYIYQGRIMPQTILFYLPKTSINHFPDQFADCGISYSTSTTKIDDASRMNNVWTVRIDLTSMMKAISTEEV